MRELISQFGLVIVIWMALITLILFAQAIQEWQAVFG